MRTLFAWLILIIATTLQLAVVVVAIGPSLADLGAPLRGFQQILQDPLTAMPDVKTQAVAILVALAATLFGGGLVAVAQWRRSPLWLGAMMAPLLLPVSIVLTPQAAAPWLDLVSQAALGLGVGALCGAISLGRLAPGAMRAAMCCGVSPLGALFRVMLPGLAPGLLAGSVFTILASLAGNLLQAHPGTPLDPALLPNLSPDQMLPTAASAAGLALLAGFAVWLIRRLD